MKKKDITTEINDLENHMMELKAKLAKLRRKKKSTLVKDYTFLGSQGEKIKLSSLFGERKELILVHNMGTGCTYCTMWGDGFNGVYKHLESRAAFVVESPNPPKVQRAFANDRGWGFKMVSSLGTKFRKDMGYEEDGSATPGISTFVKKGSKIYRVADAGLGPGDNFCIVWDLFDLLPAPKKEWNPDYHYSVK